MERIRMSVCLGRKLEDNFLKWPEKVLIAKYPVTDLINFVNSESVICLSAYL